MYVVFPVNNRIEDVSGSIGGILGTVVAVGIELAPIALQIYQAMNSGNSQAVGYLKPQFDTKIKQLNTQVAQMKSNIDNNITKLVNAKNQIEYSKIYEPLQKDWQAYQNAKNIVNRIKVHANNGNFQSVANELGNFANENQKQIISDLLQPKVKLQNSINNAKEIINKYHLDDKFKYALSHNTSGINHSADFTDYGNGNIKINNFLNKNRPNAKEMANLKEKILKSLKNTKQIEPTLNTLSKSQENLLKNYSNPVFNKKDKNKILKSYSNLQDVGKSLYRYSIKHICIIALIQVYCLIIKNNIILRQNQTSKRKIDIF